jgi:hypothetical protein
MGATSNDSSDYTRADLERDIGGTLRDVNDDKHMVDEIKNHLDHYVDTNEVRL